MMRAIAGGTVLGLILLAAAGAAGPDEEAAWKDALEKFNRGAWREAAQAFEKVVADHPQGKRLPEALFKGGQAELNARRPAEARARLTALLEKHPRHEEAAQARYLVATSYLRENRRPDAAAEFKKLFRDHPGSPVSRNALWQYWNAVEKQFAFRVHQSFAEGEEVAVQWSMSNIDRVKYRLYRLDTAEVVKKIEAAKDPAGVQDLLAALPRSARKLVREWADEPGIARRQHKSGKTVLEVPGAGNYVFEAEHDEVAVHVNVIVARYGLVTKTAKDRTLVFAVDRRTGRPVSGMSVRLLGTGASGATDEQGIYAVDRTAAGAIVGIKDGEVALTDSGYDAPAPELKAYLYTDRPVYRPLQTVHYKVVLAEYDAGALKMLGNATVRFSIRDPRGNLLVQGDRAANEFGSFSGELTLGDEPPLGFYALQVQTADGRGAGAQFRVEEYRKPEYRVDVTFKNAPVLQGEVVEGGVAVNYYFGSPVAEAEVAYEVYRTPYWRPHWRYRWSPVEWEWDDEEAHPSEGRGGRRLYGAQGEKVLQGAGKTDREGRFAFRFTSDRAEHDFQYRVVAKVTDRSRREVTGEGAARATRAQYALQLSANKHLYAPGDAVTIKVRAVDMDDKPVRDLRVTLDAAAAEWRQQRQEFEPFSASESRTDENGMAEFRLKAEKEGYIRAVAKALDRRENEVRAESWFWVSGRSWSSTFQNFNGLEIHPDKASYAQGETARVLLTSQHKNVHVLFTVECDTILRHEVVHVKGHSAVVEVPIDSLKWAPNVHLSAATLVKNEYVARTRTLTIPPVDRLVDLRLTTDRAQYRPREKAQISLEARDAAGGPVRGEFSIGIVDESIYAVQDELARDARKFFYSKRWNRVETNTSLHFTDYGRAEMNQAGFGEGRARGADPAGPVPETASGRRALSDGAETESLKKSAGGAMAATEVRGYFPDTMFWRAHVKTDAGGRASFTVDVPDSLTTWRATARGLTADARVGQQVHATVVRKEVIVRLETPRFFTQNDRTTVSAVVHNYRDDVDEVRVSLEAEGVELSGEREVRLKVPKGQDRRVDWQVAARKAGTAKLTARALTPKESDAMQLAIPVQPHGALQFDARAGMVEDRASIRLAIPKESIPEASELRISVSPTVASQVVEALEYLAGYPYGCVEQTMSRFLPTVVVAQALQRLGVPFAKKDEIPQMVAQGLQRLYNFQHADGGWGWWENDATHPYMTAYVVYGLAQARSADFLVDDRAFLRGLTRLAEMARKEDQDPDTRAYMAFALAVAGKAEEALLSKAYEDRSRVSDYSKGILALAFHRAGQKERAATLLANLDETAKTGPTHCYWTGRDTRHHWMNNAFEATAHVLRAYLAVSPGDPKVQKIVRWLTTQRRGERWISTKDTAAVVFALAEYVERTKELEADYRLTVKLNGEPILEGRVTRENLFTFKGVKTLAAHQIAAGENEITIEKAGKGACYYAVLLKTYAAVEDFKPSKGSIRVERSYARVSWEGNTRVEEPLKDGAEVKSGDEILVTLRVDPDGAHEYLMVEDPLPSGFEVVKETRFHPGRKRGWNWWYSRLEARDEKVCIAATTLAGPQTVQYTIRAETPGDFHVLPAYAYNMYSPEVAGTSAENRIRVSDR